MGLIYLTEDERPVLSPSERYACRLDIWRQTVSLFHTYKRTISGEYSGPLHSAGYTTYRVAPHLRKRSNVHQTCEPDIFSWDTNRKKALVLEITTNPDLDDRKINQIQTYKSDINLRLITTLGAPSDISENDVILSHPEFYKSNPSVFCELAISSEFDMRNENCLSDNLLKDALHKYTENPLTRRVPGIQCTIVPEMHGDEIRIGIVPIVFLLFKEGSQGLTVKEFASIGLEKLEPTLSSHTFEDFLSTINKELDLLMNNYLPTYLEYNSETRKYRTTDKGKKVNSNFKSRKTVFSRINEWMRNIPPSLPIKRRKNPRARKEERSVVATQHELTEFPNSGPSE